MENSTNTTSPTSNTVFPPQDENLTISGFNYAAFDAGAVIMASNKEATGMGNLLISDPDKYALSPSADNFWFVIGLSEEILVTRVEIANYEKYSSSVRSFNLFGAHKFSGSDEWVSLGEFERPSHRGIATFILSKPIWARYIKFVSLTIHGNEVYCTLSKIRVYGQTTLETLREDLAISQQQIEAVKTTIIEKSNIGVVSSTGNINETSSSTTTTSTHNPYYTLPEKCFYNDNEENEMQKYQNDIINETTSVTTTPTTITEEPTTSMETYNISIVNGKAGSIDNIFKTLMEKVKGMEIDISVLKAVLDSNNDKVKTAIEFLDKSVKALRDDQIILIQKLQEIDRISILENELGSLSRRQATFEMFGIMIMVTWLIWLFQR